MSRRWPQEGSRDETWLGYGIASRGGAAGRAPEGPRRHGVRSRGPAGRAVAVAVLLFAGLASAQSGSAIPEAKDLVRVSAAPVTVAAGGRAAVRVTLGVREGWHINANPPAQDYMIATVVSLEAADGLSGGKPVYPPGRQAKLSFETSALLVYDHEAVVTLPLSAAAGAAGGAHTLKGTIAFQACNDQVCLPPAKVPFEVDVTVGGAGAGTSPAARESAGTAAGPPPLTGAAAAPPSGAGAGFATAPPTGAAAAVADNPIARLFARGSLPAYLGLFLIGLALNLTPCVYPMLGVTLSIFGARKAAPPLQVFGLALLYVLGMATMYCTLGVVAALSGGLFGAALGSPPVQIGIGVLLVALSLSMFGLYTLQPPPWLLERVGGAGAGNAVGIFLSGLVVGVIAAPCVGPPVAALVLLVGAKGDVMFGFTSFFTLAMGLGAPYLLLGTFSGLLRRMPRSGEWMIWVERLFGTILLSVGAFYVLVGVAPKWAFSVMPAALLAGGVYLGFLERSAATRAGFRWMKRGVGVAAVAGGIAIIATTPTQSITFPPLDEAAFAAALEAGQPVMLDFTANWCAPCHELERFTFSDRRVREATKGFRTFRVDLTHYDSAESEGLRRRYQVAGVPSVLFIKPDGNEVRPARVEGFLAPEVFLERVRLANGAVKAAG
ncbi:MAG: hypothetical protein E6K81_03490 [Candidatus Eisenbacteria bacterium]|uniref:Thioredoxin domain-containing protein n=1 Tax=Eiseniibacteriota bacterium TaxID=2212470 RepID=A0A538UCR2_UNCEI|nr:MAG: hypothetical protein E6K81_03490 [Candidatus Eisenbacteria bacterium]